MKTLITTIATLITIHYTAAVPASISTINAEEFRTSLNRIIGAAVNHKLGNLKGDSLETVTRGYCKITRWATKDSLPGQQTGYITKSFCTAYRCVFAEAEELNESLLEQFEYLNAMLHQVMPSTWWLFQEETKEDGSKRSSISRMAKADVGIWPDLNFEICKKDGKFQLVLSVSI